MREENEYTASDRVAVAYRAAAAVLHSRSNEDTHEGEHRCSVRSEGIRCLGLLDELFTGGCFRLGKTTVQ